MWPLYCVSVLLSIAEVAAVAIIWAYNGAAIMMDFNAKLATLNIYYINILFFFFFLVCAGAQTEKKKKEIEDCFG